VSLSRYGGLWKKHNKPMNGKYKVPDASSRAAVAHPNHLIRAAALPPPRCCRWQRLASVSPRVADLTALTLQRASSEVRGL
jgi:hypothetical protein